MILKTRIKAFIILLVGVAIGFFVYGSEMAKNETSAFKDVKVLQNYPFKLGLDLSGGTHLVYRADVKDIEAGKTKEAMDALRDVIERRINIFGVSEPIVQVQNGGFSNQGEERLIVDLPGVTDSSKAIAMIGQTPSLDFRTENPDFDSQNVGAVINDQGVVELSLNDRYTITKLTGQYLDKAILEFDQNTGEPIVGLQFDAEGSALFEKITEENSGKTVAIYLDGEPISAPVVREKITGGKAQISGNFTPTEAKLLVGRLNSGALPVPIELISTETIGPSLGVKAVDAGVKSAMLGLLVIAIFLIVWYRLPGFVATIALSMYVFAMLAIFKFIPVTLTAAGIAGFIISLGIAVDANILIFERIKEEMQKGETISDAVKNGFSRAWFSIRDSNISSMISALILFWFGTALIKGFALVFLLGVLMSMISAIIVTRLFLYALNIQKSNKVTRLLFGSGISGTNLDNK